MKKAICILLSIIMLMGIMPFTVLTAFAQQEPVDYRVFVNGKWEMQQCTNYTVISNSNKPTEWKSGWYVCEGADYTDRETKGNANRIKINGDVHLILKNGTRFKGSDGIEVEGDNSLTVYAQSADLNVCGEMSLESYSSDAAALGTTGNYDCGNITVYGGNICAAIDFSDFEAAAIGGGCGNTGGGDGGNITVYDGKVSGFANGIGAGIGGGAAHRDIIIGGDGGNLTVYGGVVESFSKGNSAGIGGGYGGSGGTVNVYGGIVRGTSHGNGAGIGGGSANDLYGGQGGTVNIYGGTVNAVSYGDGAGIGSGKGGNGGSVNIYGGSVYGTAYNNGAGIGGGDGGKISSVKIDGGRVFGESKTGVAIGYNGNSAEVPFSTFNVKNDLIVFDNLTGEKIINFYNKWNSAFSAKKVDFSFMTLAEYPVSYQMYDENGNVKTAECSNYTYIKDGIVNQWSNGWYVMDGTGTLGAIGISGDVHLILMNGCKLTLNSGIHFDEYKSGSLTIYSQPEEDGVPTGTLISKGSDSGTSGIGHGYNNNYADKMNLIVHGGNIIAEGGNYSAGIGGTCYGNGINTTVYNGTVTAAGGYLASGIGGGAEADGGNLTVFGGTVIAKGGYGSAGIGGGYGDFSAGKNDAGNGGQLNIHGGSVSATAGEKAARAVGGGFCKNGSMAPSNGTITVDDNLWLIDTSTDKPIEKKDNEKWIDVLSGNSVSFYANPKKESNDPLPYLDYDTVSCKYQTKTVEEWKYFCVNKNTTSLSSKWYSVHENITLNALNVTGNANLIIENNRTLTVNGGINISSNGKLTVYVQSEDGSIAGKLIAKGSDGVEGINGNIIIKGADVVADGGSGAVGIKGNATLCDGTLTATGGSGASGIDGDIKLTVYDGKIIAKGGSGATRGIGEGKGTITLASRRILVDDDNKTVLKYTDSDRIDALSGNPVSLTSKKMAVSYLEYDEGKKEFATKECQSYRLIGNSTDELTDGWYILDSKEVTTKDTVWVNGNAKIIIEDDSTLTVNGGIAVTGNNSLTIFAQSDGEKMGRLKAYGQYFGAGIGGAEGQSGGKITIHGGKIEATGGEGGGAGIGGGCYYIEYEFDEDRYNCKIYECGTAGEITIYGGDVTAKGGYEAAGIGGGYGCNGGKINIYGGKANATGGATSGYCFEDVVDGIGCGWFDISPDNEPYPLDWSDIRASYPIEGGTLHVYNAAEAYSNGKRIITEHIHKIVKIPAKEATCTQTGISTEYYVCSGEKGCGKYFADADAAVELTAEQVAGFVISALGHSFTSGVYKDNGDGTHSQKCERCEEYGDTSPHEMVKGKCVKCGLCLHESCTVSCEWKEWYACTAKKVCDECGIELQSETTNYLQLVEDKAGKNCKTKGKGHYEAIFNNFGTIKSEVVVDTDFGPHKYKNFVCTLCGNELLGEAKTAAKAEIDKLAGQNPTTAVRVLADTAKSEIDSAGSVAEVNNKKAEWIKTIQKLLDNAIGGGTLPGTEPGGAQAGTSQNQPEKNIPSNPNTGERENIILWSIVFTATATIFAACLIYVKRKKKAE